MLGTRKALQPRDKSECFSGDGKEFKLHLSGLPGAILSVVKRLFNHLHLLICELLETRFLNACLK